MMGVYERIDDATARGPPSSRKRAIRILLHQARIAGHTSPARIAAGRDLTD